MSRWVALLGGLAVCAACLPGDRLRAEDMPGDATAGRALVVKECSECHSISRAQRAMRLDAAPGFDEIANKPQTTAISLRAFLQQSHPTMPNFVLTEAERDNAIAYILSLQKKSH